MFGIRTSNIPHITCEVNSSCWFPSKYIKYNSKITNNQSIINTEKVIVSKLLIIKVVQCRRSRRKQK